MRKYLVIHVFFFFLLTSCSYTPEERAEKVVKEFVSALKKGNWDKIESLTYYGSGEIEKVIECQFASELDIDIKRQCVIDKDCKVEVMEVYDVSESMPSDTIAAYEVVVKIEKRFVVFNVVQISEKKFKIYSTNGLYVYDFKEVNDKLGCIVELLDSSNDKDMINKVSIVERNLKIFDFLSKAVAANDSSKMFRVFPALEKNDFVFNDIPTPKVYRQEREAGDAIIICADSTKYRFDSDGTLIDCYGILSFEEAKNAVIILGETPLSRDDKYDIEYIKALREQADGIKKENARKSKAAKYKAQGVALIESSFSNNEKGAKGVKFSVLNTSDKTAKYVIMEVVGYNAVDDPVWSDGYLKRCRGIGPIAPGRAGAWKFDKIWERGDLVESYEIKALIIQFIDGTSKRVKLPQALPYDWSKWLY